MFDDYLRLASGRKTATKLCVDFSEIKNGILEQIDLQATRQS